LIVRTKLGVAVSVVLVALLSAPFLAGATTIQKFGVKHVTVTTAKKGSPSAITFTLTNFKGPAMWVTSVSSPLSNSAMMDYDANMTLPTSHMVATHSVKVRSGQAVVFSYEGQGAMLGSVSKALKVGGHITISFAWHSSAYPLPHHQNLTALVVKAKPKIYFGRSSNGSMPGMNMG
jgi:copper(I)-binding protein